MSVEAPVAKSINLEFPKGEIGGPMGTHAKRKGYQSKSLWAAAIVPGAVFVRHRHIPLQPSTNGESAMSSLAPRIAAVLALVGIVCLPIATLLGVTPMSDQVLDVAEVSFVLAAIIFLGYVAIVLAKEFAEGQTKHKPRGR